MIYQNRGCIATFGMCTYDTASLATTVSCRIQIKMRLFEQTLTNCLVPGQIIQTKDLSGSHEVMALSLRQEPQIIFDKIWTQIDASTRTNALALHRSHLSLAEVVIQLAICSVFLGTVIRRDQLRCYKVLCFPFVAFPNLSNFLVILLKIILGILFQTLPRYLSWPKFSIHFHVQSSPFN